MLGDIDFSLGCLNHVRWSLYALTWKSKLRIKWGVSKLRCWKLKVETRIIQIVLYGIWHFRLVNIFYWMCHQWKVWWASVRIVSITLTYWVIWGSWQCGSSSVYRFIFHSMFHVSVLVPRDGVYIIKWHLIVLYKDQQHEKESVSMLYYDVQKLRIEEIRLVKVP